MSAILTNAITNALHAIFLFTYFALSFFYWSRKDTRFNGFIILFFFLTFILKMLGVWNHYDATNPYVKYSWEMINMGVVLLNYCIVTAIRMPSIVRIIVILLSTVLAYLYYAYTANFLFIALSVLITNLVAAKFSEKTARLGFALIVFSNMVWIALRQGAEWILGHSLPPSLRYDNDVYHILLIISTFILFTSVIKGHWQHPDKKLF